MTLSFLIQFAAGEHLSYNIHEKGGIKMFWRPYKDVWDGRFIGIVKIILKKSKQALIAWSKRITRTTR